MAARNHMRNRRAEIESATSNLRIRSGNKKLAISPSETGRMNRRREVIKFMTARRGIEGLQSAYSMDRMKFETPHKI
jgi:hypothetical protein